MAFYVYILQSLKDGTYYKGSTTRPAERLIEHNKGLCKYTKNKTPWELLYVEEMPAKKDMLIREKKLKRGNQAYFLTIIHSPKNIVSQFI